MSDIEHVVVLMLENRSYDHMLGLVFDDPAFEGVRRGDTVFSNSYVSSNGALRRVSVTGDGSPTLTVDPPHSHRGARVQLGLDRAASPDNSGFLRAYAERVMTGDEIDKPELFWGRIVVAVLVAVAAVVAVAALPLVLLVIAAALIVFGFNLAVGEVRSYIGAVVPFRRWLRVSVLGSVAIAVLAAVSVVLDQRGWEPLWRVIVSASLLAVVALAGAIWFKLHRSAPPAGTDQMAERIMACMDPDTVPVLATLARNFTVCSRWFSSVPGATWPNRNFAHCGSSAGTVDIAAGFYNESTIFDRVEEAGRDWAIYRDPDSVAQVMAFDALWTADRTPRWRLIDDFADDVAAGRLPAYTFIEPCHSGDRSNSQHPGNNDYDGGVDSAGRVDFQRGETLIADVYEALRTWEHFDKTLLVVTYDEHGGFYDHVAPPTDAVPPGPPVPADSRRLIQWFLRQPPVDFDFTILGPRVPAIVIGGRVPHRPESTRFDHSAIPATVRRLFAPGSESLSRREAVSNTFDGLATLATGRGSDPGSPDALPDLSEYTSTAGFGALAAPPPALEPDNDLMRDLTRLASLVDAELDQRRTGFGPLGDHDPQDRSIQAVGSRFTAFTARIAVTPLRVGWDGFEPVAGGAAADQ